MEANALFSRRVRFPAILALALIVLLAVQLALPAQTNLPPAGSVARVNVGPLPADPAPVFIPASLIAGGLFAPVATKASGTAPTDPLNGTTIAGVVQRGSLRLALVTAPAAAGPGTIMHYVPPGGLIAGWRLVSLGQSAALLQRGDHHLDLAYGAHAVSPAPANSADKTQ